MKQLLVKDSRNGRVIERCPICHRNLVKTDANSCIAFATNTIRAVHPACYPEFHVRYQCGILKSNCSICQGVKHLKEIRDSMDVRQMMREAEPPLNDQQRELIQAYKEVYQKCHLGKINLYEEYEGKPPIWEWEGGLVYNFGADFIIPYENEELEQMILNRDKAEWTAKSDMKRVSAIYDKVEELGGEPLIWN